MFFHVHVHEYHTQNRAIEDLYEELVRQGIIVQYPKTRLSAFTGEYRYIIHTCTCTLYNIHMYMYYLLANVMTMGQFIFVLHCMYML